MARTKRFDGKLYDFAGCWPVKMSIKKSDPPNVRLKKQSGMSERDARSRAKSEVKSLRSSGYYARIVIEGSGPSLHGPEKKVFIFVYKRKK